eukprot:m.431224 g.431224  ORF g.431224 m.431224 type:complete len:118 (-) comp17273_c0_seq1:1433-1786(-)
MARIRAEVPPTVSRELPAPTTTDTDETGLRASSETTVTPLLSLVVWTDSHAGAENSGAGIDGSSARDAYARVARGTAVTTRRTAIFQLHTVWAPRQHCAALHTWGSFFHANSVSQHV